MSRVRRLQIVAAFVSCCGFLLPCTPALAEGDLSSLTAEQYADFTLDAQGNLHGVVVDADGHALPGYPVVLVRNNEALASTTSDEQGRFTLPASGGGACVLATNDSALACRVWNAQTAPPAASEQALLVVGQVDRAQRPAGPLQSLVFSDPVILGLVVAGAVAVPIIIHNSQNDSSSASGP